MKFLLLFLLWPVVELVLIINIGQEIGVLATLALLFLAAILGSALIRVQGMQTLARAQARLQQGQLPEDEMLTGVFLFIAGVLLVLPGFGSDILALLCLIPGFRRAVAARFLQSPASARFYYHKQNTTDIIDGEWSTEQKQKNNQQLPLK